MFPKLQLLKKHGPRFGLVAIGLLSGAMVLSSLQLKAAPVPKEEPNKEEPKKDAPKPEPRKSDVPAIPGFPDLKELLPADVPPEVAEQLKKQMEQLDEIIKKMQQGGLRINPGDLPNIPGDFAMPGLPGFHNAVRGRMGATVRTPDATLVEQLDLPKNQGLVIADVKADSAAAKAGLKANDILLELNGKPVSNEPREFVKMLQDVKPNTPVDAVVLRKGKKETIKGLSLPESPKPANLLPGGLNVFPGGTVPGLPGGSSLNITRAGDNFSTTYNEGKRSITVNGKVDQGKAQVEDISVTDNGATKKYKSVDDVPAELREKVKNLIQKSAGAPQAPQKKID